MVEGGREEGRLIDSELCKIDDRRFFLNFEPPLDFFACLGFCLVDIAYADTCESAMDRFFG